MTIEDRVRDSLRAHAERVSASLDSWSEIERRLDPGSTQPSVRQRVLVAAVALTITAGAVLLVVRAFGSGSTRPASIAPGDTLLFSVRNSWFPDSNVFALSGGSKDVTPYLAGPTSDVDASISPDASSVAFSRDGDIFVMGLDGSGLLQVTHDERNQTIYDEHPVWSPDGTKLAFERDGRRHRIWIVGSDGSDPHPITDAKYATEPAWSPDGTRIAYTGVQAGSPLVVREEIYTVRTDGSGLHRLTDDRRGEQSPAWSPNGNHIAFVHHGGTSEAHFIWTMAADGSDVRHVTSGRGYDSGPVWSPDGSRIVFTSDRSLDHHGPMTKTGDSPVTSSVFVVSAEGGPLTSVASLPDGGVATSWIPGGVPPLATIDTTGTVTGTFRFSKVQASPSHDGFGPSHVHVSFDARWAGDSTPRAQVCTETLTDPAGRVVARQSGSFSAGEGRFTSSWDVRRSSMIAHVDRRDILTLHASIRCTNPNPPGWNVVTASSPSSTS